MSLNDRQEKESVGAYYMRKNKEARECIKECINYIIETKGDDYKDALENNEDSPKHICFKAEKVLKWLEDEFFNSIINDYFKNKFKT